jgi:hypothetical protein
VLLTQRLTVKISAWVTLHKKHLRMGLLVGKLTLILTNNQHWKLIGAKVETNIISLFAASNMPGRQYKLRF